MDIPQPNQSFGNRQSKRANKSLGHAQAWSLLLYAPRENVTQCHVRHTRDKEDVSVILVI